MIRRYELVIFDLDGTLVDSAPDLCAAVNRTLTEFALPTHGLEAVRRMIGEGQRVLLERAVGAAAREADPGLVDRVVPRFREHYARHLLVETRPYPGVEEALAALPQGLARAVATNKPGAWAREIVDRLGLRGALPLVLGEDDVGRRKPDPALLFEVCRRLGVAPARALFVGDSLIDMRTAAAAGVDLALCLYGYLDPETRQAVAAGAPPCKVARCLQSLTDLLGD